MPEAEALKREALAAAERIAKQFPDDPTSQILLAAAYHNQGDTDKATSHLKACLAADPERADAYAMLAMVAQQKGNAERCVELCRLALAKDPTTAEVYHRLGQALMELGRTDELIEAMQQAIQVDPRSSQSHYLLGQGHLQARQHAEAKQSFLAAVGIRPDHTQARFGLYTACVRLGQREEADRYRREFERLEAIDRAALRDNERNPVSGTELVRRTAARTLMGAVRSVPPIGTWTAPNSCGGEWPCSIRTTHSPASTWWTCSLSSGGSATPWTCFSS